MSKVLQHILSSRKGFVRKARVRLKEAWWQMNRKIIHVVDRNTCRRRTSLKVAQGRRNRLYPLQNTVHKFPTGQTQRRLFICENPLHTRSKRILLLTCMHFTPTAHVFLFLCKRARVWNALYFVSDGYCRLSQESMKSAKVGMQIISPTRSRVCKKHKTFIKCTATLLTVAWTLIHAKRQSGGMLYYLERVSITTWAITSSVTDFWSSFKQMRCCWMFHSSSTY